MRSLKRESLVDQIHKQLRESIITLFIPLGSRLSIAELQEEFHVSSTPIREALNRLQVEGLVTYESNVGARVISLDEHDVTEIQELAMTMHAAAIRFAMARSPHETIAADLAKQLEVYKNATSIISLIMAIHDLIDVFYRHCGNSRLSAALNVLDGPQLIVRYIFHNYMGENYTKLESHDATYEAVLSGDTEKIVEIHTAAYQHVTQTVTQLLRDGKVPSVPRKASPDETGKRAM